MDAAVARDIALHSHRAQRDRDGAAVVHHLARVAAAVPAEARAVAWLHDLFERSGRTPGELVARGLSADEAGALELLTRRPEEPYTRYVLRIAEAAGDAGRLARLVKLADLDDRLSPAPTSLDAPPYAWARRRVAAAQGRHRERPEGGAEAPSA